MGFEKNKVVGEPQPLNLGGYMAEPGKNEPRTKEWLDRKRVEMTEDKDYDELMATEPKTSKEMSDELEAEINKL